jgi:hypothetical protein
MLAHLVTAFLAAMTLGLLILNVFTHSAVLEFLERAFTLAFHPVGWAVTLTGYALALFLSGAFDLRPVIGRSTLYGASLVCLTFLFAVVEEVVEAQLATRVALPEGMGTWAGAASIALLLGPIRNKVEQVMQKFLPGLPTRRKPRGD